MINNSCIICFSENNTLDYWDNCQHQFCKSCIIKWLKHNNTCPICRRIKKKNLYYILKYYFLFILDLIEKIGDLLLEHRIH